LYPEAHQGNDVSLNQRIQGLHNNTQSTSLALAKARIAQGNYPKTSSKDKQKDTEAQQQLEQHGKTMRITST
jgi:hypothetical protein